MKKTLVAFGVAVLGACSSPEKALKSIVKNLDDRNDIIANPNTVVGVQGLIPSNVTVTRNQLTDILVGAVKRRIPDNETADSVITVIEQSKQEKATSLYKRDKMIAKYNMAANDSLRTVYLDSIQVFQQKAYEARFNQLENAASLYRSAVNAGKQSK